ncbi:unnamed protein product [Brassica napus]|uniref:(rape) hypothetical protein n=1 Tax=Brassica napus TaxID=3708 RepID=A0A816KK28_BRANA|nr:unnamed protein product [Brassica napus]
MQTRRATFYENAAQRVRAESNAEIRIAVKQTSKITTFTIHEMKINVYRGVLDVKRDLFTV